MKIIFTTIFLFVTPFFLFGARAVYDFGWRTSSGITVEYMRGEPRNNTLSREIRELDRELTRIFKAPAVRNRKCSISIAGDSEVLKISRDSKKNYRVFIGANFPADKSAAARRDLAGALLAMRFAVEFNAPLPEWLAAGLEHVRLSNRTSGRIIRNSRNYPFLRAILSCDSPPDWRNIISAPPAEKYGAELKVYQELSRAAMEIFVSLYTPGNNALGEYAAGMLAKKMPHDELFKKTVEKSAVESSGAKSFEKFMEEMQIKTAFNSRNPRSADYSLRQLERILTVSGKPDAWFTVLPERIGSKDVDAVFQRSRMAGELRRFSNGIAPDLTAYAVKLAAMIEKIDGGSSPKELQTCYLAFRNALRERLKLESMLEAAEMKHVSPFLIYADELREIERQETVLSAEGIEFLNEVEKKYLND